MQREQMASRLGFILVSAGCAIGLGNVWRFPYITGKYGGAVFVAAYLFFLIKSMMSATIVSKEDLAELTDFPVIGVIPHWESDGKN